MLNDGIECSDIWTDEFVYGLYMNISIAYKTVGDIDMAIVYARKYLDQNSTVASSKGQSLSLTVETFKHSVDAMDLSPHV